MKKKKDQKTCLRFSCRLSDITVKYPELFINTIEVKKVPVNAEKQHVCFQQGKSCPGLHPAGKVCTA